MSPWAHVFEPLVLAGGAVWEIVELLAGTVSLEEIGQSVVNFEVL